MCINIYITSLKLVDMCMKFHCIGAYVDGQECEGVVAYKNEYLKTLSSLHSTTSLRHHEVMREPSLHTARGCRDKEETRDNSP